LALRAEHRFRSKQQSHKSNGRSVSGALRNCAAHLRARQPSVAEPRRAAGDAMSMPVSQQELRERAYRLWEARGRPHGSANEDWRAAEAELRAERDAAAGPLEPLAKKAADVLESNAGVKRRTTASPAQT